MPKIRLSRRLAVKLCSSALTGFAYWTTKSPHKEGIPISLLKYDPVVDARVMFYEAPRPKHLPPPGQVPTSYYKEFRTFLSRTHGRNLQPLLDVIDRRYKAGEFEDMKHVWPDDMGRVPYRVKEKLP